VLLGQDELTSSVVEVDLEARLRAMGGLSPVDARETERILLAAARVGQHVFAVSVLANCGHRCVFCGFAPPGDRPNRMLVAGHIKPWRDSSNRERRDHRNGLAACPTHDVAFDTGLITVNGGLAIHLAARLDAQVARDEITRHYFARPPLREAIVLPDGADLPGGDYLRWHREHIFAA
jgi:putative restriction endonuclease